MLIHEVIMRRLSFGFMSIIVVVLSLFGVTTGMLLARRQSLRVTQIAQTMTVEVTAVGTPIGEPSPTVPTNTVPWYVDLPPTDRAIEEAKEVLQQNVIQTVTAMAQQGTTAPPIPTLEFSGPGVFPISEGRRSAGAGDIIDDSLNLVFRKEFKVSNVWTATLEGIQVIVYAGHDRETPQQGGVFVQWGETGNTHPTRANQYYPAPDGIGSVRIVDAVGAVLLLSPVDRTTVQFDVLAGSYNSLVVTPTAPLVTEEPYPAPVTPVPATVAP